MNNYQGFPTREQAPHIIFREKTKPQDSIHVFAVDCPLRFVFVANAKRIENDRHLFNRIGESDRIIGTRGIETCSPLHLPFVIIPIR